jgi:hypothetical protein
MAMLSTDDRADDAHADKILGLLLLVAHPVGITDISHLTERSWFESERSC